MQLDHITIRTSDLPRARAFFLEVFPDLEERPRPKAIERIPGHWLYSGEEPIVHLIGSFGGQLAHGGEAWDHIGFRLDDFAGFRDRLERLKIAYAPMELPELCERRLFFRTPGGPLIEAVFRDTQN
ncbi:VOC family protein [Phaeobacter gallaeciensis]|uniref:Lactoylglutathione lyase n=1 Tax=Phaeobacter gallaeciensis TaxID=60890 RepID=A0AAC9ZDL5_9RHOB|nr:lactoylglutathione lyase [Phaeobacter gallaeciensis]AHD11919.1 Lactoylglutathione lyase [Phaeobacter gallaeciensis DSM 26640]ATE95185.1 Lactoylglutathione lyase [Phaeobacter gallaeciensis]ATE99493.1 Lactoylglutathione lyase [Phaeobacter gallaeciensis]ATF03890.1 Lactoylglutathione lyase [Phaeobacter gallaeciensis]ATF08083.1 Lactoylglutathione lyase [Phaeobacter gallaeciensis]